MYFAKWLTPAQKRAIADVAIASSELEAELERCIVEFCHLWWPHGAVLLDKVSLDAKLTMLNELIKVEFRGKTIPEKFSVVHSGLKDLNSRRNLIIHGEWMLRGLAVDGGRPGDATADIKNRSIVVRRRKRGANAVMSPLEIKKVADLTSLYRELLHQLFWDHFPDRVVGLSGLPTSKRQTAARLEARIRRRQQRP